MTVFKRISPRYAWLWLAGVIATAPAFADGQGSVAPTAAPTMPVQQPPSPRYEDAQVKVRVVMRTPDQLAAFYLGRGFNRAAIDKIEMIPQCTQHRIPPIGMPYPIWSMG